MKGFRVKLKVLNSLNLPITWFLTYNPPDLKRMSVQNKQDTQINKKHT